MDLTPLAEDDELSIHDFVESKLSAFTEEVLKGLS